MQVKRKKGKKTGIRQNRKLVSVSRVATQLNSIRCDIDCVVLWTALGKFKMTPIRLL